MLHMVVLSIFSFPKEILFCFKSEFLRVLSCWFVLYQSRAEKVAV